MSKHNNSMAKPVKYTVSTFVLGDQAPVLSNPRWKELYYYGEETGAMNPEYERTKDPALGEEMLRRMRVERDEWLRMTPPEFPGAAKKSITMIAHMFSIGYDKHAINAVKEEADKYVTLSPAHRQEELRAMYNHNVYATSLLACCSECGKHTPPEQKRLFCGQCHIAVYCGPECQKKHGKQGHRELCGQQRMCQACGKLLEKPLFCGRCGTVCYCDKAHQQHNWKWNHKKKCKKP
jgi:hypothetical protein